MNTSSRIAFPNGFGPCFSLTVDTEEEFEWGAAFDRASTRTQATRALAEGQRFFEGAGVKPLYYIDQPVVDNDAAAALLGRLVTDGKADVGVHLHPWVTPPFVEEVNTRNSYAGNLPRDVERAKLRHVRDAIVQRLDHRPLAYRAGRYGIGPSTLELLAEEGFRIDSSVRSLFDYRDDGGPDFRTEGLHPRRCGPDGSIIQLPLTTVYSGRMGRFGRPIFPRLDQFPTLRSFLARAGWLARVPLTPEGTPAAMACGAIDVAIDIGLPLLTMSFHSPSLAIGHTPYVRDAADLAGFYRWFDHVFDHLARRGIAAIDVAAILAAAGVSAAGAVTDPPADACQSAGGSARAAA